MLATKGRMQLGPQSEFQIRALAPHLGVEEASVGGDSNVCTWGRRFSPYKAVASLWGFPEEHQI